MSHKFRVKIQRKNSKLKNQKKREIIFRIIRMKESIAVFCRIKPIDSRKEGNYEVSSWDQARLLVIAYESQAMSQAILLYNSLIKKREKKSQKFKFLDLIKTELLIINKKFIDSNFRKFSKKNLIRYNKYILYTI